MPDGVMAAPEMPAHEDWATGLQPSEQQPIGRLDKCSVAAPLQAHPGTK